MGGDADRINAWRGSKTRRNIARSEPAAEPDGGSSAAPARTGHACVGSISALKEKLTELGPGDGAPYPRPAAMEVIKWRRNKRPRA